MHNNDNVKFESYLPIFRTTGYLIVFALIIILFSIFWVIYPFSLNTKDPGKIEVKQVYDQKIGKNNPKIWMAPDLQEIKGSPLEAQILYGAELISHTSKYLGPNGTVAAISNGMNCQNCHLDAGTKVYGNNYGSVAATFPKFRARSGSVENIYKRVNDCIERSLNGQAIDTMSIEMQAIKAYLLFLGRNVEKGTIVKGSGLKEMPFLDRPANLVSGKQVYLQKCTTCHKDNGQGVFNPEKTEYTYPPLWGRNSFNDAAGIYRLGNMAKYVKANMPFGASYLKPQLSDEEAWDVSAFIISQPRPHKDVPNDWPDKAKKPFDHPFGPYTDGFSETQHKYGPFPPIIEAKKAKQNK